MTTVSDIKKRYCLDEDVVNFMGHRLPKALFTAISRLESANTDQSSTGFFRDPEHKKKFVDTTNQQIRYIEQNIRTADPKEQPYVQKKLKSLKNERDRIAAKLMVLKGSGK